MNAIAERMAQSAQPSADSRSQQLAYFKDLAAKKGVNPAGKNALLRRMTDLEDVRYTETGR